MQKLLILPKLGLILLFFSQVGCQGKVSEQSNQDLNESSGKEIDVNDSSPTSFELKIGEKVLINGSTYLTLKEITTKEAVCESFNVSLYYNGMDCETDKETEAVILALSYKGHNCTDVSEAECMTTWLQMDLPLVTGEEMDLSSGDSAYKITLHSTTQSSALFEVY